VEWSSKVSNGAVIALNAAPGAVKRLRDRHEDRRENDDHTHGGADQFGREP